MDKFFDFFRLRVSGFVVGNLNIIFDAGEFAELCFNDNAVFVCISDNFLRTLDVLFEVILRAVVHDRCESIVDASLAGLKIRTVVKMQGDRNVIHFESCEDEMAEIRSLGVFTGTGRCL